MNKTDEEFQKELMPRSEFLDLLEERDALKEHLELARHALKEVKLHHGFSFSGTTMDEVNAALTSPTP